MKSRWLIVALLVSVAVNLTGAGYLIGAGARGAPEADPTRAFPRWARSLPAPRRDDLRPVMSRHSKALRPELKTLREHQRALRSAIGADPYDADALADVLAQMRDQALFVNTSRSGLVEPGALEAEISKGRIFAAVDVFDEEPLHDSTHPLLTHPNVLPTPHIGYVTEDEFDLQFTDIFQQINAYAAGAPIHMINPEVWAKA